jgi:taurine--2-oxoglutarate transaminase
MSISDVKCYDREHIMHSWSVQSALDPMVITKTKGVYLWDDNGKRYLDMVSQLINQNIGHQHRKVVEAIKNQAEKVCFVAPGLAYESRSFLGKALAEVTPYLTFVVPQYGVIVWTTAMNMLKMGGH